MDRNEISGALYTVLKILSDVQVNYEQYSSYADEKISDAMENIRDAMENL